MPEPGLYLVNASGEGVPVLTEGGGGDHQLLEEFLADAEEMDHFETEELDL